MPGEPAHGYLKRVATRYGTSAHALGARFGISERGLTRGVGIELLAQLGRIDAAAIITVSPIVRARDRRVDLAGEEILLSDWSTSSRRWCGACLAEDAVAGEFGPYQRYWWDINSIAVCPVHLLPMSAACGACGRPTKWQDCSLRRCACGRVLADVTKSDVVIASSAEFSRYLGRRVGVAASDVNHHVADRVPLFQLPKLVTRVGMALIGGWSQSPLEPTGIEMERLRSAGLACLNEPRQAFTAALDRTVMGRSARSAGLIGAYGWIYSHWLSFPDQDPTRLFASMLREHAVATGVVSVEEPVLGFANPGTLSLTGLADRLGLSFSRTKKIVLAQGSVGQASRRGVALPITEETANSLVDARSKEMLVRDVSATLGVGKRIVAELTQASLLTRSPAGLYSRAEVEQLAGRLSQSDKPVGRIVSLVGLARSGAGSVAELCVEVLAGTLQAVALTANPVKLADVGLVSNQVAGRRSGRPLTIRATARVLEMREDVTRYLAATGILSGSGSTRPTLGSVGSFKRDFVTTVELSRSSGLSSRRVWRILEGLNVSPAFGPPLCRQLIYQRSNAERTLFAHLIARG